MQYEFIPSIPYYYQIKEDILQKIEQGIYSVGDQLVSEIQLAEDYGVSRPTVRQAIAELVQEGILVRGRGKGTFVSKPMIADNAQVFTTFAHPEDGNRKHFAKVIEVKRAHASTKTARDLDMSSGDEVHEIVILQMNSEEKLATRVMQIPVSLAPHLSHYDLNNESDDSVYDFLQKKFGLVPASAVQSFQCVAATEEESALLEIEVGDPLMLWQGVVYSMQNIPIIRVRTLFRGDRFKFYITQGKRALDKNEFNPIGMGILDEF